MYAVHHYGVCTYVLIMCTYMHVQFLKDEFMNYLEMWKKSVMAKPRFKDEEKKRMMLSQETLTGIKITDTYVV